MFNLNKKQPLYYCQNIIKVCPNLKLNVTMQMLRLLGHVNHIDSIQG